MQRISKDDPGIEFMLFLYYDRIFCVIIVLYGSTFKFARSLIPGEVDALTAKIEKEYAATHIKRKTWKAGML